MQKCQYPAACQHQSSELISKNEDFELFSSPGGMHKKKPRRAIQLSQRRWNFTSRSTPGDEEMKKCHVLPRQQTVSDVSVSQRAQSSPRSSVRRDQGTNLKIQLSPHTSLSGDDARTPKCIIQYRVQSWREDFLALYRPVMKFDKSILNKIKQDELICNIFMKFCPWRNF